MGETFSQKYIWNVYYDLNNTNISPLIFVRDMAGNSLHPSLSCLFKHASVYSFVSSKGYLINTIVIEFEKS